MVAGEPTSMNEIQVRLNTIYSNVGIKELERDIRRLQATRIERGLRGGKLGREQRADLATQQIQLQRMEKATARMRSATLFTGLSIMFFGMAVAKALSGMLSPAAELAGIMEIIGLVLTLLFLPVMLAILPHLLRLLKYVSGLSKETKIAIGVIVLLVFALATLAQWIAMVALGWSGISTVLGVASTAATGLALALGATLATLLAGTLIIGGVFAALKLLEPILIEVAKGLGEFLASLIPEPVKDVARAAQEIGLLAPYEIAAGVTKGTGEFVEDLPLGDILGAIWDWTGGPAFRTGEAAGYALSVNILNSPGVQTDDVTQTTPDGVSEVPINTG